MFNPIPKDAPEFFTAMAHYLDVKHTVSSRGPAMNRQKTKSRFYIFSIGRSIKDYILRDKYIDEVALALLTKSQKHKERLVLKGYLSPNGVTAFITLTHIGIYYKPRRSEYQIFNPETGELGYYQLNTG